MSVKALEHHLKPLSPFLEMDGVTEICINKPGGVFVEKDNQFSQHIVEELEYDHLAALVTLIAEFNDKKFPSPLLSGSLPTGERIQCVMSPACEKDRVVCSIRRQQMRKITLDDYQANGAFDELSKSDNGILTNDELLKELYYKRKYLEFVKLAIRCRKNILICGGTGTGKTTFLNACLEYVPKNERIITVEDTREVIATHHNSVHLLFNENNKQISSMNIFKACLRLRPDRILLSELRGNEVWPYLRAANSGHPGSLSTVHADTPEGAFNQMVFMMQQTKSTLSSEEVMNYIKSVINIVIQLKRCFSGNRYMYITDVYFDLVNNK